MHTRSLWFCSVRGKPPWICSPEFGSARFIQKSSRLGNAEFRHRTKRFTLPLGNPSLANSPATFAGSVRAPQNPFLLISCVVIKIFRYSHFSQPLRTLIQRSELIPTSPCLSVLLLRSPSRAILRPDNDAPTSSKFPLPYYSTATL